MSKQIIASSGNVNTEIVQKSNANFTELYTLVESTGNLLFDKPFGRRYGTWDTPVTGDLVIDETGAQDGYCAVVVWSGDTTPNVTGGDLGCINGSVDEQETYNIYFNRIDGRYNVNILKQSTVTATGKKLVFLSADGQYAVGTAASVPAGEMSIEVDFETDIGGNNKITYAGLNISRLNATQIYFGIAGGFDLYPMTPAEMVGKKIKYTWNNTTFDTSVLVDGVPLVLDSTSGTKGDADTTVSMGLFVTQTAGDVAISGLKIYKGAVLENDYNFDPETETTTLEDLVGTQNFTITVGTGTIDAMWQDL